MVNRIGLSGKLFGSVDVTYANGCGILCLVFRALFFGGAYGDRTSGSTNTSVLQKHCYCFWSSVQSSLQ